MKKMRLVRFALIAAVVLVAGGVAFYQVRQRLRDRYVSYVLAAPDRTKAFRIANESMSDFQTRSHGPVKIGEWFPMI